MSILDSIQYPVDDDPDDNGWPQFVFNFPIKFSTKWELTKTPSHLTHTEFLREIILNWNEDDELKYGNEK
jgi:hypothetical protein